MAIFTRRVLQTMLDHLEVHLPIEAREKLAHELNRQSSSALGFEWETALLFGFSKIGKVDYEAPSSQGSRPDITFIERSEAPTCFTADVATVSDDGLEDENPAMRLSIALTRLKRKYELSGSTNYTIKGEATGPHFRNRKMRLKLPPGPEIEKMLEEHVVPMLKRIQEEKLPTASIAINEPGIEPNGQVRRESTLWWRKLPILYRGLLANSQSRLHVIKDQGETTKESGGHRRPWNLPLRWQLRAFEEYAEARRSRKR
jgi:hypothetical protein